MLKKTMILASMAVAAMALALPATSSAVWSKHTKATTAGQNDAVTFSGNAKFSGGLGGIECGAVHSNTQLTGGTTTGHINQFTATVSQCKGTGGLAFCTVNSVQSTNTPWLAHTNGADIQITTVHIDNTLTGSFCPYHELTLHGEITITPETAADIDHAKAAQIHGKLTLYNNTPVPPTHIEQVNASGTLNVSPSGTYGLK